MKRVLGCCNTMDSETSPLTKATDGISCTLTSCSGRRSETSGDVSGEFSNDVSGEIWGASRLASQDETDWRAEFWLASVTPGLTGGLSVSSGDGGASPSAPRDGWLSATRDESAGALPSWCTADWVESSDIPATSSLIPTAASKPWVTLGAAAHSAVGSRQRRLVGLSADTSSAVAGLEFVSVVGICTHEPSEGGISSRWAWDPSDPGLDSCCGERAEAGSGADGLLSMGCSDVWLLNSQWSLGRGCDLSGWTDSLAQSTTDELVWSVASGDIQGKCSPGDTVWADAVPSTDGGSWLGGMEGPDGWTAIC